MNAADNEGDEVRMSRETAIFDAPRYTTKARPMALAADSLISVG